MNMNSLDYVAEIMRILANYIAGYISEDELITSLKRQLQNLEAE